MVFHTTYKYPSQLRRIMNFIALENVEGAREDLSSLEDCPSKPGEGEVSQQIYRYCSKMHRTDGMNLLRTCTKGLNLSIKKGN